MKRFKSLKSVALVTVTAAATMLLIQACGGGAVAQSADVDAVEGSWEAVITVRDCITGATILTARGQQVFHRGGTLTDTNAAPPTTRGVGFGTWLRDATAQSYSSRFRFNRYNPDGTLAGSQRVTRVFTLSADGNTQTSTNTSQTLDVAGTVLQNGCAGDVSTRVP
ncbi:MAG: hypothetical protein H7306_17715 [Bacteriovorax sp.]|nr:hypothetical protein [Rhizobacter sp.]